MADELIDKQTKGRKVESSGWDYVPWILGILVVALLITTIVGFTTRPSKITKDKIASCSVRSSMEYTRQAKDEEFLKCLNK